MEGETAKGRVCVTGAGGFLSSWLVKLLLSRGYTVHGTLREPGSTKYAHLNKLEKASENLKLFKADILDYNALLSAIQGCSGVFHVASPVPSAGVPNPEVEVLEPAVKGTLNVLKAGIEAKVQRVVIVSSQAAVSMNPQWPKDKVMDETCWSDEEYCKQTNNWYFLSKTKAEAEAFKFAKSNGLDVVSVCPALVLGPMLQSTANSSSMVLIKLLREGYESLENKNRWTVDVRDVADALLLTYEKPEAEGRYICTAYPIMTKDLVDILRKRYPDYDYPQKYIEVEEGIKLSSEKLQRLGWRFRPLEETIIESVQSYQEIGLLK